MPLGLDGVLMIALKNICFCENICFSKNICFFVSVKESFSKYVNKQYK